MDVTGFLSSLGREGEDMERNAWALCSSHWGWVRGVGGGGGGGGGANTQLWASVRMRALF